jgi:radical SAM-linked protein
MESYKIRFKFQKINEFKYLSHLETVRLLVMAARRAKIPIKYSEGFSPNPKLNFSFPVPVGLGSFAEYADMDVYEKIDLSKFIADLNKNLGKGMEILDALFHKEKLPSLMADISIIKYVFRLSFDDKSFLEEYKSEIESMVKETCSVWMYEFAEPETDADIVYLNLFGYTKLLNNNKIFKFNDFLINLKILSSNKNVGIMDFFKKEAYVIRSNILKTPMCIV